MQAATEALERVALEATQKHVQETRVVKRMAVGQVARQGDIYLHRVADDHAHGRKLDVRQLAPGVTTGSRHVAESPARVHDGAALPAWAPRALLGPCVVSKKRFTVSHPEHAHVSLPAGRYQVTYQRDERTGDAVRD